MSEPSPRPSPTFSAAEPASRSIVPSNNWLESRLQPDLILPTQFNDLNRRSGPIDGESRLLIAILEDAVRTYLRSLPSPTASPRRRAAGFRRFAEISEWFNSRARNPFSFEYICEALGTHPDSLRRRLSILRIEDFPTKQMHAVGRRHIMRPRIARKRSRTVRRQTANREEAAPRTTTPATSVHAHIDDASKEFTQFEIGEL
jgi:hypothetical protein